jgi:KUP system potassium uptake protein
VLRDPSAIDNPFFRLVPDWGVVPMVILAAAATVIASQAVISGAFSLTAQAMRMGYLPRLRVVQTSGEAMGQVYLPSVNWLLMGGVLLIVLGFQSSSALSSAYGIAVSVTMITTTMLASVVALKLWRWKPALVLPGAAALLAIDLLFTAANSLKIAEGGWLPLAVAALVLVIFTTWSRGRSLSRQAAVADRIELASFVEALAAMPPHRVKGTAVFLTSDLDAVPHALLHNLKHNQVLHERVIILQVVATDTPRVDAGERIHARQLPGGFWQVSAMHGFMERPNVPELLKTFGYQKGVSVETMTTSYFTSRETVGGAGLAGMGRARHFLFTWLHRNAGRASDYFSLPPNRVVELGRRATA